MLHYPPLRTISSIHVVQSCSITFAQKKAVRRSKPNKGTEIKFLGTEKKRIEHEERARATGTPSKVRRRLMGTEGDHCQRPVLHNIPNPIHNSTTSKLKTNEARDS